MKKPVMKCIALFILVFNAAVLSAAVIGRSYDFKMALEEWSQKAVFGYGYEYDYNISHFYSLSADAPSKDSSVSESAKVFDKLNEAVLREMYLEFYQNDQAIKYLVSTYKLKKDWRNFNHISKKIQPDTAKYFRILEDYVKKTPRCADFANDQKLLKILKRKSILEQIERMSIVESFK